MKKRELCKQQIRYEKKPEDNGCKVKGVSLNNQEKARQPYSSQQRLSQQASQTSRKAAAQLQICTTGVDRPPGAGGG